MPYALNILTGEFDYYQNIAVGSTVFSGGTEGSVLFIGPSGVVSQDNSNFYWDNTNNRLRIADGTVGFIAPQRTLDVRGTQQVFNRSTNDTTTETGLLSNGVLLGRATVTGTYNHTANQSEARVSVSTGVTNSGFGRGFFNNALRNFDSEISDDGGTLVNLHGIATHFGHYNELPLQTPQTTNVIGFYGFPYALTGTITNLYGLYLDNKNGSATITNYYGVYQKDITASNYFGGRVGIGDIPANDNLADGRLFVYRTATDLASQGSGIDLDVKHTITSNNAETLTGINFVTRINQNGFNATSTQASRSAFFSARVEGASGTVTGALGITGEVRNTGAGTVTIGTSFRSFTAVNSGGGTFTTYQGFLQDDMNSGLISAATAARGFVGEITAASNRHNLYMSGTAQNYLAGNLGIGQTTPTAYLHLAAGTTGASTAPIKFTSGSLMTSAEAGAVEFLTDKAYVTITTGPARKEFTMNDSALTPGKVPVATTNGRLTDSGVTATKVSIPLFDHFVDANNGTTVETDLYSDTLAAGQLATNADKVIAQYAGTFVGDATSSQRLKAYFGGTLIFDSGALSIGVATDSWDLYITTIRVSSSVVRCSASLTTNFATLSAYAQYTEVTGLTLANTQVMKITGTAAGVSGASNQITAKEGYVEWKPAA